MVQLPYILTIHKLNGLVLHPACLEELEGRWVLEGLEVPWLLSNLEALEVCWISRWLEELELEAIG